MGKVFMADTRDGLRARKSKGTVSVTTQGDDVVRRPRVKKISYDESLIQMADSMIDDAGEKLIDVEGVKEFFDVVEHELRPSPIELRTLRHILATYKFTEKAKEMMTERCGLGPDPPIWDAILCYFGFIFIIVAILFYIFFVVEGKEW